MDFLFSLLPKIQDLGLWIYWLVLVISALESTVAVGLIIPGSTVVVFSGFLASQDIVDFGDLIWMVAIGGIIGDGVSFYLGQKNIHWFQEEHRFFKKTYLEKGEAFFKKHGEKSVVLARFIGPIRPIVPFVAGLFEMPARRFFFYNILSSFVAAVAYLALGYFFGAAWGKTRIWLAHFRAGIIITVAALLVGYLLKKKLFSKKSNPQKPL